METNARQAIKFMHRPLCCRYLVVHFRTLSIQVQPDGSEHEDALQWGFGVMADGQSEVLGAWLNRSLGGERWKVVIDDLKIRGVERISFLSSREQAGLRSAVRAAYPDAAVLPYNGQLQRQTVAPPNTWDGELASNKRGMTDAEGGESAFGELDRFPGRKHSLKYAESPRPGHYSLAHCESLDDIPLRFKRVIQWGDAAVQQLHNKLKNAVARQSCFADQAAAALFAIGTLARAESRLGDLEASLDIAAHRTESATARSTGKPGASRILTDSCLGH